MITDSFIAVITVLISVTAALCAARAILGAIISLATPGRRQRSRRA